MKEYLRKLNLVSLGLLKGIGSVLVELKLFATFREGRFRQKSLELPDGAVLSDVVDELKLPAKPAKILLVNGIAITKDCALNDGDVIAIFPMIAGG